VGGIHQISEQDDDRFGRALLRAELVRHPTAPRC
jgi:hypothetical protein